MSEILKFEGKLGRLKMDADRLRLRMRGLISSLRDLLDPTEGVADLQTEIIAEQAVQLSALRIELRGIEAEMEVIKKILGR